MYRIKSAATYLHILCEDKSQLMKKQTEFPIEAFTTFRQLRDEINKMPEEALDQPAQFFEHGPDGDIIIPLSHFVCLGTIGYLFGTDEKDQKTRGSLDNKHHPEHYVIMLDGIPFSKDGDTYFTMTDEGMVGNNTGKVVPFGYSEEDDD